MKIAIAELVAAVAARVSLVRKVAYPSHRRVDCHSPRRAEELGKEEVEFHASSRRVPETALLEGKASLTIGQGLQCWTDNRHHSHARLRHISSH